MDYKEIEIEGMKEILRDKEEEIKKLKSELEWYHGFDNYLTNHGFDMKKLKSELFKKNQN